MSGKNVELLRRAYEAFNRGDLDRAVANVALDCEYVAAGAIPGGGGVHRGPGGFRRWVEWFWADFEEAHVEIHDFVEVGDQVLASLTFQGRGKRSGVDVSMGIWQVWTMRDGLAVRGQGFTSRDEALEAVGLREEDLARGS